MDREKKIIKTSILGIVMNVILVIFKAVVGLITNSIAIILDAVNNLTDVISSVVTIVGTKLANKKPDREHPYGHGRIEYFATIIIAVLILVAGIIAMKEAIEKIINPAGIEYSITSMVIIALAVIVKYAFSRYAKKVGKDINSQTLVATGQDAFMDAILSFATLVAAIINYSLHLSFEGYLGILISVFIIKTSIDILKDSVSRIIGERADKEIIDKIKNRILLYDDIQGVCDLILHNYGPSRVIGTANVQVRDKMTAQEIHTLTKKITSDIFSDFGIIMSIGIYATNEQGEFEDIRTDIGEAVKEYENIKQMHGLYVDSETNSIFFDLIFDFECKDSERIRDRIVEKLKLKYPEYNYYVMIDADMSE